MIQMPLWPGTVGYGNLTLVRTINGKEIAESGGVNIAINPALDQPFIVEACSIDYQILSLKRHLRQDQACRALEPGHT